MLNLKTCISTLIVTAACANAHAEMQLDSKSIENGATLPNTQVFSGFGCEGGNKSPHLRWKNAPEKTKSFAISVYDPDAPTGSGWWHWTAFNIPKTTSELPEGVKLESQISNGVIEGRTDYGSSGFGGACPPPGDKAHRYIFTVYALDTASLPLDSNASGAMFGYFVNSHTIEKASITAFYGR